MAAAFQVPEAAAALGWRELSTWERIMLRFELAHELPRGHVLSGRSVTAIARQTRNDDVLFRVAGKRGLSERGVERAQVAVVHLTYHCERRPDFPWCVIYDDVELWVAAEIAQSEAVGIP